MARFILSKKVLLQQYERIKKVCDEVAYSLKTNPIVGKILEKMTDSSFEIFSPFLIDEIEDKNRILYTLQGDKKEEIEKFLKSGVRRFVVDNENDLKNLIDVVRTSSEKIDLLLRIKAREHTIYTGKYFVYGFSFEKANKLIEELSKEKVIENLGIHFHRKTQNVGEWFLKEDFEETISLENRKRIKIVDIGGGIPWFYVNSKPNIEEILRKIEEFRKYLNENGIKLITEPGRFLAAPCIRLETEIINVYDNVIVVDASLFNGAMDVYLLGFRYPVLGEKESGKEFIIKGRSADSLDIFRYKVFFDREPKIGEKIVFENAGAYNFWTDFSNFPKLKTEIVKDF